MKWQYHLAVLYLKLAQVARWLSCATIFFIYPLAPFFLLLYAGFICFSLFFGFWNMIEENKEPFVPKPKIYVSNRKVLYETAVLIIK